MKKKEPASPARSRTRETKRKTDVQKSEGLVEKVQTVTVSHFFVGYLDNILGLLFLEPADRLLNIVILVSLTDHSLCLLT